MHHGSLLSPCPHTPSTQWHESVGLGSTGGTLCTLIWVFIPINHLCLFFDYSLVLFPGKDAPTSSLCSLGSCHSLSWCYVSLRKTSVCSWWTVSTYGLLTLSIQWLPFHLCVCAFVHVCLCMCWSQGLMNAIHILYHWATPLVVPTFHFFWLSSPWTQRHSVITFFKGYASCVSKCIRQKLSPLPTDTLCDRSLFPGFPFSKSPLLNWYYLWVTP
jgi:hypothetical protein